MSNFNLHYAYWLTATVAKKLGAWGLLGLILSIASLLFYTIKMPQMEQLIETVQTEKDNAIMRSNVTETINKVELPQNTRQEITSFYERFPKASSLPEALSLIYEIANKQKLALNSGDYKFNLVKQANLSNEQTLTKYEIVLPIKGQYTQIRTFISEVLLELPALALTVMQFNRENTLNPNVEAKLVFVLFVKDGLW